MRRVHAPRLLIPCFLAATQGLFLFLLVGAAARAAASEERPNVILILTDDQGHGDVGVHGNTILRTPNMDRLAAEGVRIKEFYVTPICSTTRASLLTGRYNQRTGVVWPFWGAEVLRHREVTIAEALKEAGYRTAIVGKWHLGRFGKYGPRTHGFDEFFGFRDGMIDDYFDTDLEHNGRPARISNYITDALTEAALRFVEANRSHPFFLYLSYNAPHIPNQVPQEYEQEYIERGLSSHLAKVYGMITCMDDGIGRILEALKTLGLDEKTIILFLSDNGPQMETSRQTQQFRSSQWQRMDAMWKGAARYNSNLRGEKATVYEGGIRSPFFARWPGRFPAGKTLDMAAAHIDVVPTILELCGVTRPEGPALDGKSLASFLKSGEGTTRHEKLFFWSDPPPWAGGRSPAAGAAAGYARENWAVRSGSWKLVQGKELYHLEGDPAEQNDVAARQPEIVRELQEAFDRWADEALLSEDLSRPPVPVGPEEETPSLMSNAFRGGTVVDIAWAQLHGPGIRYGYDKLIRDRITGWTSSGDFLRWDIDVGRRGRYEVILQYGCPSTDAGSRIQIRGGEDHFEVALEPTAAVDAWETRTVGFLNLEKGLSTLEIRPLSVAGKQVMDLHEVRLRWSGEQQPEG